MAMTVRCANAIRTAAAGRQISDARLKLIDDAIGKQAKELARQDRTRWQGLTREQRTTEAAAAAMQDVQAQAALTEFRARQQVIANANTAEHIRRQRGLNKLTESQATSRVIEQAQIDGDSVTKSAIGEMRAVLDAAESKDGTGVMRNLAIRIFGADNPRMTADIVREVFANASGFTGNKIAHTAAKAWLETIERLRVRFNAAGGDVGKLGYGYLSQAHDAVRLKAAGAQAWAAKVFPLLDREQYVRANGSLMDDAEVGRLLLAAHDTLANEGMNKFEPGQFKGVGARANRGSDHRVLHFKDGEAWTEYMKEFGDGSLYDVMIGHVGRMGRDIALVENFGPNPEQWFRVQQDIAQKADGVGTWASRAAGNQPEAYWKIATGATGSPENRLIARVGQDLRNVQTAAKITWGPLSAFGDIGTIAQTLHFNNIPYFQMVQSVRKTLKAEHRAEMVSHGIVADSLVHTLNRFTGDHMAHGLSGRITNGVMHASLLNAWTDTLRGAFSDVLMHNWAGKIGSKWGDLTQWDQYLLQRKGLTEADWSVITKTAPAEISGRKYVTPASIADARVATRWHSFVTDESMFAVVNPDAATRAIITWGGMPAGTMSGEVARSIGQFKSFPLAMLTRHWRRVFETPQGLEGAPLGFRAESASTALVNRVAVLAALGVTGTFLGALQTQGRQVAAGKDPIDMTGEHAAKFWAKAFSAGGGAGFIADVLLTPADDPSRRWEGHFGLAGPVAGAAGGLIDIAKSKAPAAEGVAWLSNQAPFVDMWQTRAVYEHWFLHWAQEGLNPGYLARMERRAQQQWGQAYAWQPGTALPERLPNIGAAFGRQ